ncbi:hypothetical protein CDCA_CDCA03G1091 [Cyanidium caldarium]|uniref:Histidinol dehydrogenase n=1 Tax=Cyanidium caldarium TaxID=2771 RepID=A0AAV9ISK1_CYACA|nr:hypothetical protein CDCA_CDCA03G1091 [Cyanidium caldarium]
MPGEADDILADHSSKSWVPVYGADEAQRTILRRRRLQDATVPPPVAERIRDTFGEPLTPQQAVQRILASVERDGDAALLEWTALLDAVQLRSAADLAVGAEGLQTALQQVEPELAEALRQAAYRIVAYHRAQPVHSWLTTALGGQLGQLVRPMERVGFYVPGGAAPLPSTVLMSVLPAVVAGVSELVVVSPPTRDTGDVHVATLAACAICAEVLAEEERRRRQQQQQQPHFGGSSTPPHTAPPSSHLRVFRAGGAQAVAALAYGTDSVPRVDKIVGPGNLFVTLAKREVFGLCGIDGVYGPTEAVVVADDTADAARVAADLLAQAEHDYLAVPILLTPSSALAGRVVHELERQVAALEASRAERARHSLSHQGGVVLCASLDECLALCNAFATEHVSLSVSQPWQALGGIRHAGGVFLGEASCEVLGDYVAGPSHVMPTGGSARYSSPLSVLDFVKVTSVVALDDVTVRQLAPAAERLARAEGLTAHARAAALRK